MPPLQPVERCRRHLAEVGRFMLVGGAATAVALVIFNVLVHGLGWSHAPLADNPIGGYVVANAVGMLVSYQGSRTWVFRDRPAQGADGGFTAYVVINVATMALPVACLVVSRGLLGLDDPVSDNIAANVVGLGLGQTARFVLFRTLVFRSPAAVDDVVDVDDLVDGVLGALPAPVLSVVVPTATARTDPDAPPSPAAAAG